MATFARPRLRGAELLRPVAEGTNGEVGEASRELVRSVAEALAAKLGLVAEAADPSGVPVRVVAGVYAGAPIEEPFEYDTVSQPCALVPGQTLASFPEGLVEQFPEDQGARDMGLDLAVCLRDSRTNYLDQLVVLDERRIEAEPEDVAVLKSSTRRSRATRSPPAARARTAPAGWRR